jgi:PKD repeat protein
MKHLFLLTFLAFLIASINSCSKTPSACFQVYSSSDSIRIGEPVTFDASCAADANEYNWSFGGDLIDFGKIVTIAFDSAKVYEVELITINGRKTTKNIKEITVYP